MIENDKNSEIEELLEEAIEELAPEVESSPETNIEEEPLIVEEPQEIETVYQTEAIEEVSYDDRVITTEQEELPQYEETYTQEVATPIQEQIQEEDQATEKKDFLSTITKNKDVYIMESNHDIEMLNNGSYPYELRKRIYGDKGHLSNLDSSKYLSDFIGDKTKYIMLAHLSEENNTEEIAMNTLKSTLKEYDVEFDNIYIAKQDNKTENFII
jgi:hypothetical protein